MTPEHLLSSTAQGDINGFKQFYELFKAQVYNVCLSHLQNTEDAEEVTQDVFLEIHRSAASFSQKSKVSTWVYRIAINKSIDKLRHSTRQKRSGEVSSIDDGVGYYSAVDFHHPGILSENREKAAILFKAIRQLPDNQQSAFILKFVEGLSQKEIAGILDMGEKAVESLLQRAKSKLRDILKDYYHEEKDI